MPRTETELLDSLHECGGCPTCGRFAYTPEWEIEDKSFWFSKRMRCLGDWFTSWCPWCNHIIVHFDGGERPGYTIIKGRPDCAVSKGQHTVIGFGAYLVSTEIRKFMEQLENYGQSTTYCTTFYWMRKPRDINRKLKSLGALLKWFLGGI